MGAGGKAREINETTLFNPDPHGKSGHLIPLAQSDKDLLFSTESESPFLGQGPATTSKMTGIFIDRFFNRMKFKDLAVRYDLADHTIAGKIYREAVKRLHRILEALERERNVHYNLRPVKVKIDELAERLSKNQKFYLLYQLFDLTPHDIARLEGGNIRPSRISEMILRVSDKLRCGEIRLFQVSPEETHVSRERLDLERSKAQKRYHERKVKNGN